MFSKKEEIIPNLPEDTVSFEVVFSPTSLEEFKENAKLLYEWRDKYFDEIIDFFKALKGHLKAEHKKKEPKIFVCVSNKNAFSNLPAQLTVKIIEPLNPVWGILANVKNEYTMVNNKEKIWGTKHFHCGEEVVCIGITGDKDVAEVLGQHRETKKITYILTASKKFDNWRIGKVTERRIIHWLKTYSHSDKKYVEELFERNILQRIN